jgi:hypothetical protein
LFVVPSKLVSGALVLAHIFSLQALNYLKANKYPAFKNGTTCNPTSGSYCHGLDASSLIFLDRRASKIASMSQDELTALGPTYTCQSLTGE